MRISLLAALVLTSCASTPPSPPAAPDVAPPTASPPATPASAAASTDAPPRKERPLDLTSSCPRDVKLYYGDQPGDGKGQSATVATGATLQVPRGSDGAVVVWVVDDKGAGLGSVHVTRRMKHVTINADCGRIDAN